MFASKFKYVTKKGHCNGTFPIITCNVQIKTITESIILRFYASTLHFYYAKALSKIYG